jgi:hypothetical protein
MKLRIILVIFLLLPSVSFGQTGISWDIDMATPVHGREVDVGFGKKLWNSIGLIVAPDVVKRNWPLYAYNPEKVRRADPCQDGSRFADLSVGHDVALVIQQGSRDSANYTGWTLRPRSTGNAGSNSR